MAIRIEWDEFEIALLIEACEEVLRKGKPKSEVVKTVSSNLRKRAISKNIAIDDVFRNENGIALQMQKMAYLLTHGEKGMPGASKLYAEVAELREENPKKFEEILKRAKEEIEMTDLSQQNIDKKALFAQWLNEHPIKKYTPSAIIDELLCDNSVMDAIIDRFGPDVQTYAGDLQNFRVIEEIAVGKVFFNWIFGFEGKVRIKGPESVKKQYREMVMSAMNLV